MMIKDIWYNFKYGISNLFYFFKVIWNYRNFDYGYLLEIEKRAMIRMKKYYETCNITYSDTDTAKDLDLCINILNEMEKCTDYWYAEEREGHKPIKKINMKNSPYHDKELANKRVFQYDWYEHKCWKLYNLIRAYKMQTWWN